MKNPSVIFTYPAVSALVRNFAIIRKAEKVILFEHADHRHPALLNKYFIFLCEKLFGQAVETRTIKQTGQARFSADVVSSLHDQDFSEDPLSKWLQSFLKLPKDSRDRYVRRVSLERAFAEKAAITAINDEFQTDDVSLFRVLKLDSMPTPPNVADLAGFSFFDKLACWFISPFVLYLRVLIEFKQVRLVIKNRPERSFELVVYEIGFQHESMQNDMGPSETKNQHKKNNSSLVYVYDRETTCKFISDIWRPSGSLIDDYKAALNENGFNFYDWTDFKISLGLLTKFHIAWLRASLLAVLHLKSTSHSFNAARVIGLFARESIIFENLETKGILGFDDYSERAIIRKHVAAAHNVKALCIQHSANDGIRSGAEISTVDAHYYLTLSPFARAAFKNYWPQEAVVHYGYARLDAFYADLISRDASESPFTVLDNPGCPVVVMPLRNIWSHEHFTTRFAGASEWVKFLSVAVDRYKDSLNLYLRPKQLVGWEETIEKVGFPVANVLTDRHRVTAEYLYFADFVISNVGSGIMSECALLKTKFALFDIVESHTNMYDQLGSGFLNANADELIAQLDLLAEGKPLEIDHAKSWELFSDPYVPDRAKMIYDLVSDKHHEI